MNNIISEPTFGIRNKVYPKVSKLTGPVSLTILKSKKHNKLIYVFGDIHVKNIKCLPLPGDSIPIEQFLEEEIKSNDKMIDIFLEIQYISSEKKQFNELSQSQTKSFIIVVKDQFKNCLSLKKDACLYKNVRFHYADIRFWEIPLFIQIDRLESLISKFIINKNTDKKLEPDIEFMEADLQELEEFFEENFTLEYIIKQSKIGKQLENISDKNVSEKISKYYEEIIFEGIITINSLWHSLHKLMKIVNRHLEPESGSDSEEDSIYDHEKEFNERINKISYKRLWNLLKNKDSDSIIKCYNEIRNLNLNLMDMYLISRMFRNYKELPDKYSGPAENIIIYVGDHHAGNYISILLDIIGDFEYVGEFWSYGDTKNIKDIRALQNINNITNFQCLDISQLSRPIFK